MKIEQVMVVLFCVLCIVLMLVIALRINADAEPIAPEVDTSGLKTFEVLQVSPTEEMQTSSADIPLSAELQKTLFDACDTYGVEYAVGLALIQTESNFEPDVVSGSGCYGLCQLNPYYFPSNLTPGENIEHGIRYLASNIAKYGDVAAGLCAYNAGHDNGSRSYSSVVLARAEEWRDKLWT